MTSLTIDAKNDSNGKVAIVTIQNRYNYGNRLQNYATDYIYRSLGYTPTSLILKRRRTPIRFAKDTAKAAMGLATPAKESLMSKDRLSAFERFNNLISFEQVTHINQQLIDRYLWFSVGSDQIWGLYSSPCQEDWRFLTFVPPEKRIALSPSIGTDYLSARNMKRLARLLEDYRKISVRESNGAKLIQLASSKEAEVLCDPCLVLNAEAWRSVAASGLNPARRYVLVYILGTLTLAARTLVERVAKMHDAQIVNLSDSERPDEPPAGPSEFISLIDNAEHVVTDSFHASLFSTIFRTPLTILRREGGESMFSRLENLVQTLRIEEKVCRGSDLDLSRAEDYEGVSEAVKREREKFMEYLEACLDV